MWPKLNILRFTWKQFNAFKRKRYKNNCRYNDGWGWSNEKEEISDLHISAISEAMNQMIGSAATSMSSVFNKRIDISPLRLIL